MPYTITDFISKEEDGTYKWSNRAVVIDACHNHGATGDYHADLKDNPTPTLLNRIVSNIRRDGLEDELNKHSTDGMELTITFKEYYRMEYNDMEIRNKLIIWMNHNCHKKFRYILYPEYGKNFNLHYHGVIWGTDNRIKTLVSKLKRDLKKEFGFTYIAYIRNYEKYLKYITKEQDETDEDLMNLIIRYDF